MAERKVGKRMTIAEAKLIGKLFGFKLYHDVEWSEYRVTFSDTTTYHTDDIEDAVETGIHQVQRNQMAQLREELA